MQDITAQIRIDERDYDGWRELVFGDTSAPEPVVDGAQALRALADYAADIVTVMRALGGVEATAELCSVQRYSALWHAERVWLGLVSRATGGRSSSALSTDRMSAWTTLAGIDRAQTLTLLADECGWLLYVLNVASGNRDIGWVASSRDDTAYGHAERAHTAVLTLLADNAEDGRRLHELWSGNQEPTAHNLRVLTEEKRAAAVIVTVAADGDTATITLPDEANLHTAGRVQDEGLLWVADPSSEVIGHNSAWIGIGELLVRHYEYPTDTAVIVEYAADTCR